MAKSANTTRRRLLKSIPVVGLAAIIPAATWDHEDPLLDAIRQYREGLRLFNESHFSDDASDAMAAQTYAAPMETLCDWSEPAESHLAAVEALRLAEEELTNFASSDMARAMVTAALGYIGSISN